MQHLKSNDFAGTNIGTCICIFLSGIDKPSLKTAVKIYESQDSYSTNFHTCALYHTSMVQKTPAKKRVHIAAA